MTDKRLFLHVGSFKTGSTAIQGFLKANAAALADAGLHYVSAGRTNIAHNSMVQAFRQNQGAEICDQIAREIDQNPAQAHVVSSEMFFTSSIAKALGKNLPKDLKARTTVVVYVRRQDKYLEAMYKQLVKNGRIAADAMQYHDARIDKLAYSRILGAYAKRFGVENMIVRPFERNIFVAGDVVMDFLGQLGVTLPDGLSHVDQGTNRTLSAPVSEMLGMLGREAAVNTRKLIRVLIAQNAPGAVCSGDVYDLATRRAIVARHQGDNNFVHQTYCPKLDRLFDETDLHSDDDPFPSVIQQVENWRLASMAIAKGLGGLAV